MSERLHPVKVFVRIQFLFVSDRIHGSMSAMQMKTTSDIGALTRDRRTQLRWSQAELAKRVGVSRLWIVQLEKGKPTAQIGLVLRVLKELGIGLNASPSSHDDSSRKKIEADDLDRIIRGTLDAKS